MASAAAWRFSIALIVFVVCATDIAAQQSTRLVRSPWAAVPLVRETASHLSGTDTITELGTGAVLSTLAGAGAGAVAGWLLAGQTYESFGCCGGGDDPGLSGQLVFSLGGAVLGSAVALSSSSDLTFSHALKSAAFAALPGAAGGVAGGFAAGHYRGWLIGLSVAQGVFTILNATGKI